MAISQAEFQQAMNDMQAQMANLERGLTARIALAESEVLRLRSSRDEGSKTSKSGILDARKIYPQPLKDMGRWKPWAERVLRWARMQSGELHAALTEALRSRDNPVTHDCGDESIFLWAHLEDWLNDPEAASIVKHVRDDDGIEAFRQLNCRYDPVTALTKSHRLKAIQRFVDKNKAKKNTEVPDLLARFDDLLLRYHDDYKTDALSDDLKKEALKELIPVSLEQAIKDIMMYRDVKEDTLNSKQIRGIIDARICADVQNQIIRMEVDAVQDAPAEEVTQEWPTKDAEWVASLGYGPTQGAVGKSGKGKDEPKGKGKGKDWKGGGDKGKNGAGAGKGERPVGACSHCWGFGHYYRACPIRLGPEAAAAAEKAFQAKGGGKDWKGGKGKGKGKGKGYGKKGVFGIDSGEDV